jgi:hypothetical protein
MAQITTDTVKIQIQNLIMSNDYKAEFKLHNPSSLNAYLDREELYFTAAGSKQNIFLLITKDADLPIVAIEIITTNLTDNTKGSASMIVQCSDYTGCGSEGYFLPLMLNFIP